MSSKNRIIQVLGIILIITGSLILNPSPVNAAPTGQYFDYSVTILMENTGINSIIPSASYMTTLANTYSLAQHYTATVHPSEGNYVALISGDDYGFTSDCGYCPWRTNAPNIVDRLEAAGLTWQAFAEDASGSGTCSFHPPRGGDHFAFITFSDLNTPARCSHFLTATSDLDPEIIASLNSANPPNYLWLTPNDCNNMHDCSVSTGDAYLASLVPRILATTTFQNKRAALIITFDEGDGSYPSDYVYWVAAGTAAKLAYQSSTQYSHYSYLHTMLVNWGLPSLTSNDGGATSMAEYFGTSSPPPPPGLSGSFSFSPSSPTPGQTVTFTATASGGTSPYTYTWAFGDGSTGSGSPATHAYTAGSYTTSLTVKDSASPQASVSSSRTVTVQTMPTGNFDSSWYINNCPGGTETISSGVLHTRQSTPSGNDNNYGYCTAQRGTFPWRSTVGTALPSGITTVTVSADFLSRNLLSGSRYHIYVAYYYTLDTPVTVGGTTYSWMDTQVRIENIGGTDSPVGSTGMYDPGDSFGWDLIVAQLSPGQSYTFSTDVEAQFQDAVAAWGISGSIGHSLDGIEIGTEGYHIQEVDVDWPSVSFDSGSPPPPALSTSFTFSPSSPLVNTIVAFTATTTGGISPYTISWNFGDGATGTGASVSHTYTSAQTFTVTETARDSTSPQQTGTSSKTVTVSPVSSPDFTTSLNPTSLTVNVGQTGSSTVTVAGLNGFAGVVSLASSISPSTGLSCNVAPTSLTASGTASLSCTPSASGTFTITVRGTSGSLSHSAIATYNVPQPNFSVTAIPTTLNVAIGIAGASTIAVSPSNGFTSTVSLSSSASPGGLVCSLTVTSITGGSGASTLSCSGTAGTYTVSVTGSGGSLSRTATVVYNVQDPALADFTLASNPQTVTLAAGSSGTSTVTLVSANGFSGTLTIAVYGDPELSVLSSRGSLTLPAGSSRTLTLTITLLAGTGAGSYTAWIDATSGSLTHSGIVTVESTSEQPPGPPPSQQPQGQGTCSWCHYIPSLTTNTWLFVMGGFMGLILTISVMYVRARNRLENARRMRRMSRHG